MIQAIIVNFSIPTFADELGNFDIQPLTPTENMFVFTSPENTVYDGTYMSNLPPIDAGTYSVLIDLSDLKKNLIITKWSQVFVIIRSLGGVTCHLNI